MLTRDWTATTYVIADDRTLLLFHRKLQTWLPPGGHIDPHELPHRAAVREAREETGLEVELFGPGERDLGGAVVLPQPLCILLEDIAPDHQHIDLIYMARPIGGDAAQGEGAISRWFAAAELEAEPDLLPNVREYGLIALQAAREAAHGGA